MSSQSLYNTSKIIKYITYSTNYKCVFNLEHTHSISYYKYLNIRKCYIGALENVYNSHYHIKYCVKFYNDRDENVLF